MKTNIYIFTVLLLTLSLTACSSDDDNPVPEIDPMADLYKVFEISKPDHVVEVYSEKQRLEVGYNEFSIRVMDKSDNTFITDATPSWMPMMHMENMSHSGPHSNLTNSEDNTIYKGHLVFQMAGNETEYWDLTLNYSFKGETFSETKTIDVLQPADGLKKTQVFMGADEVRYVLAYVNPQEPEVAVNDMEAVLYKMEDMMTFPVVENFTIAIDPRMPGMGNHSSPNNQDLVFDAVTDRYEGKLSLTMTGYWKINLKVLDENGTLIKGEDVSEENPSSSLYFELEF